MAPFRQTTMPAHMRPEYRTGRPSEFRPEYCELVIEHMSKGYSLTAFAGLIRVARDSVYEWIKAERAFSDAVARARSARVNALEIKLLRSRKGAETSAAIFALRNACPDEWRDIKHTEHNHHHTVETLTDAQLYAIAGQSGAVIDGEYSRVEPETATD
jgi:formylmethanofuran dehydrogenase subunit A